MTHSRIRLHTSRLPTLRVHLGLARLDERTVPTGLDTGMGSADLGVTNVASRDSVVAGTTLTYKITVTNAGPDDARDVQLRSIGAPYDDVVSFTGPAGWTTTTPPGGTYGTSTATIPLLPFGAPPQVFTLVFAIGARAFEIQPMNNNVTVDSATTDPNLANNTVDVRTLVRPYPLPIVTGADAGGGPHVVVYDSFSGGVKFSFMAYDRRFTGGVRVAAGDVTGDGIPDIVTAAGPGGGPHVIVFDGATGAEVRSFFAYAAAFRGGVFVAAADVNSDFRADIITGADAGGGPHVIVFDGADGSILQSFYAYDPAFTGGVRVAAADVTGDGFGYADIITGAGPGGGPDVRVFSGTNAALVREFYAYDPNYSGGVSVAAGDLDNDGRAELITSAGVSSDPLPVTAYDGKTGTAMLSLIAYGNAFDGSVRVAIADVGGDGQLDIVTGAGPGGGPHVIAHRGSDLNILTSFYAYDPAFIGGVFVG